MRWVLLFSELVALPINALGIVICCFTYKCVGYCYFKPHSITDFQPWVWLSHGLDNRCHVCVDGKIQVVKSYEKGRTFFKISESTLTSSHKMLMLWCTIFMAGHWDVKYNMLWPCVRTFWLWYWAGQWGTGRGHIADGGGGATYTTHVLPLHGSRVGHPGGGVNRSHRFLSGNCEVPFGGVRVPTFGYD